MQSSNGTYYDSESIEECREEHRKLAEESSFMSGPERYWGRAGLVITLAVIGMTVEVRWEMICHMVPICCFIALVKPTFFLSHGGYTKAIRQKIDTNEHVDGGGGDDDCQDRL